MPYGKEDIITLEGPELRAYQLEVLKVTKDLVSFFEENEIRYSLSGGSILGAVRHQGFIPWDDDIDINMPRRDYDKMLAIFEEKLGSRYFLQTPGKRPELGLMVTQVRKRGTVARRKYDWQSPSEECGVSVDIYVMENVFNDPLRRFVQEKASMFFTFAISSIRFRKNLKLPKEIEDIEGRKYNYPVLKRLLSTAFCLIPLRKWVGWCDFWNRACKDSRSTYVAIPTGRKHFRRETYLRADMCRFRKADFEGCKFNIPANARKYLREFYGDYMSIPPVSERERHIFLEISLPEDMN